MAKKIDISDIQKEINSQLEQYTKTLSGKTDEEALKVVKHLVNDIKASSPVKTGDYKGGWTYKKDGFRYIVHNRTNYQLTHLLEFGHAKVSGGRVSGKAHIRPAELTAIRMFEEAVRKAAQES